MSSGPRRPFVSVKFTPAGRTLTAVRSRFRRRIRLDDHRPAAASIAGSCPAIRSSCRRPRGRRSGPSTRADPGARRTPAAGRRFPTRVVRRATREDIVTRLKQQQREQEAQRVCLLKIRERGLAMKLTRVEQLFDGSRLIFYYTAEGRVDFRELVRDLAAHFRDADRDAADRRPRRSEDARRLRLLRPSALLHDVAADVRAGLDQDGEAAEPQPESVEAVGHVRPAEVLPPLRAAERQGGQARRLRATRAAADAAAIRPDLAGGCGHAAAAAGELRQLRSRCLTPDDAR